MPWSIHVSRWIPDTVPSQIPKRITIGADNGAIPEIITNGETGFLIKDQSNSEELSELLHEILHSDPQRLKEIGKAARQEVLNRFSLNSMVDKLEEYVDKYLTSR